jgi:two-component system phosphate regulon sensor histidine kinase PhoR
MKSHQTKIFIIISAIALASLLAIQIVYLIKSAKIKEDLFNEKAIMALSKTVDELCADKQMCANIGNCCSSGDMSECKLNLGDAEIKRIDSLLKSNMAFYNFHIDYSFEMIKPNNKTDYVFAAKENNSNTFKKKLEEVVSKNGVELKLIFPDKKQFILAEMGPLFISSVALILILLLFFWQTVRSLLKEKMIAQHTTDFLNNMTHEFKTPLTNISLASKMMVKEPNVSNKEKVNYYSNIISDENEKLRLQVEQVLGMTELERGEIPIVKTEINIHELLNNAAKSMQLQLGNKEGELNFKLDATKFILKGDKNHLLNTFCNLIDNAIKYAKEKPEIAISTSNNMNFITILVSDKGVGIEPNYRKKVFEKFFRVPTGDVHNVKGFGLGLAYVKKIIELHNGTIELESELNKGTTFKITLPLA